MIDISSFRNLIGRKIDNFFVVLWPPLNENSAQNIDIFVGFRFSGSGESIITIGTDKDDNWTPVVSVAEKIALYDWHDFNTRVNDWMNGGKNENLKYEFYNASYDPAFNFILASSILDVEFITLKDDFNPFGVKLLFLDDSIVLSSISDGCTFETSKFNKLNNVENYKNIGEIELVNLNMAEKIIKNNR